MRRVRDISVSKAMASDPAPSRWIGALGLVDDSTPEAHHAGGDRLRLVLSLTPWILVAHGITALTLHAGGLLAQRGVGMALALLMLLEILFGGSAGIALKRGVNVALLSRLTALYGLAIGLVWAWLVAMTPIGGVGLPALALIGAGLIALVVLSPLPAAAIAFVLPPLASAAWRQGQRDIEWLTACFAALLVTTLLAAALRQHRFRQLRAATDRQSRTAGHLLAEFEASGRGWFWETDARGMLTYISAPLAEAVGRTVDDLLGRALTELVFDRDPLETQRPRGERTLGFHISTRLAFADIAVRAATPGEIRWWSLSGRPAFDDFGNFLGFRGNGSDLTEMRRSEAEVQRLARYDALTGLPNRVMMKQTLDAALRDASGTADKVKPCAFLLIDLDRFKSVNDTLGHPVGDVLLRQVAERLLSVVGDAGQVGRLGGDEFDIVLPGIVDRARLAHIAAAAIERISAPYMIEGSHVSIGASVGIAIAPGDGMSTDSLVRNADLALYAAKGAGKGVHRFYEPDMHAHAKDRRLIEIDLRKVLSDGDLHLVYQPVVNAMTETITGFEALVRWNHPTRGPVSPANFIPIAEEIGLIQQIGEWVLRTACHEAAKWPDPVRVAVNISPIQFASPALPGIVMSALAASGLPAQRLELEITEGVFMGDGAATDAMFARLKAIGVRFALDDFGTGYSSLGYLKKAPFNKIKIDQSFVRGAAIPGNRNAAIIKAIVSLAESLGMDTTAEGAETHDELDLIRSLGCSHIQGYIFGKPLPADEARARAASGAAVIADGFLASRSPRVAVLRSAMVRFNGRTVSGRVRNLSTTGALVETERARIPCDTAVEILFPDGSSHSGMVRWAHEERLGVTFDLPFDLELLNAQRPARRVVG